MRSGDARRLAPAELGLAGGIDAEPRGERLSDRPLVVLVGLTGAGKTTTVDRLAAAGEATVILPDRRALTDDVILPMMTGRPGPVTDRVERFKLTAAFKERHPGGMGDVLKWLVLPADLPPGMVLFDGLRGEAEVTAAVALPKARFAVLDCTPEDRLQRLCGRNDPFDRVGARPVPSPTASGVPAIRSALASTGFGGLVAPDVLERTVESLATVDPAVISRSAAIIVEESHHYDPAGARDALARLALERTLVLDTGTMGPGEIAEAVATWLRDPN